MRLIARPRRALLCLLCLAMGLRRRVLLLLLSILMRLRRVSGMLKGRARALVRIVKRLAQVLKCLREALEGVLGTGGTVAVWMQRERERLVRLLELSHRATRLQIHHGVVRAAGCREHALHGTRSLVVLLDASLESTPALRVAEPQGTQDQLKRKHVVARFRCRPGPHLELFR